MNIILLANNWVGWKITQYLRTQHVRFLLLGIHEPAKQAYTRDIIRTAHVPAKNRISASCLTDEKTVDRFRELKPDMIVCAFWGYLLSPALLSIPTFGSINIHPGYLPFNRGMNPNVWPLIEHTPAGVTIHRIDSGIDTGPILARKKIPILPTDTAGSIEQKTWTESVRLFTRLWPNIKNVRARPQQTGTGSFHRAKDVNRLDEITLHQTYTARELIDRIRARSYPNSSYAYYREAGKKVFIRVDLSRSRRFITKNQPAESDREKKR